MTISQSQKIKGCLALVEHSFQALQQIVQKHSDKAPTEDCDAVKEIARYLNQLQEDLIKLVHLDNLQLHHPYVKHYLLSWPNNYEFLYKLHRGLAVGVKRQLNDWEFPIVAALYEPNEKIKKNQLAEIYHRLVKEGKLNTRQAFFKIKKRLQQRIMAGCGEGPFFDATHLPIIPRELPSNIKDAWERASANLKNLRNNPLPLRRSDNPIYIRARLRRKCFHPFKSSNRDD